MYNFKDHNIFSNNIHDNMRIIRNRQIQEGIWDSIKDGVAAVGDVFTQSRVKAQVNKPLSAEEVQQNREKAQQIRTNQAFMTTPLGTDRPNEAAKTAGQSALEAGALNKKETADMNPTPLSSDERFREVQKIKQDLYNKSRTTEGRSEPIPNTSIQRSTTQPTSTTTETQPGAQPQSLPTKNTPPAASIPAPGQSTSLNQTNVTNTANKIQGSPAPAAGTPAAPTPAAPTPAAPTPTVPSSGPDPSKMTPEQKSNFMASQGDSTGQASSNPDYSKNEQPIPRDNKGRPVLPGENNAVSTPEDRDRILDQNRIQDSEKNKGKGKTSGRAPTQTPPKKEEQPTSYRPGFSNDEIDARAAKMRGKQERSTERRERNKMGDQAYMLSKASEIASKYGLMPELGAAAGSLRPTPINLPLQTVTSTAMTNIGGFKMSRGMV